MIQKAWQELFAEIISRQERSIKNACLAYRQRFDKKISNEAYYKLYCSML